MNTTYVYSPDHLEEELFLKTHKLLEEYTPTLYSQKVHDHLKETYVYGAGHLKRSIMLPMPKEKWYPKNACSQLVEMYESRQDEWPTKSHYNYAIDYSTSQGPGFLCFGYAITGDTLYPCAFFTNFLFTMQIAGIDELFPEEYVIDPMAIHLTNKPECYIGITVSPTIVEEWLLSDGENPHPLETHMLDEDKKRVEEKDWEREIIMGPHSMLKEISSPEAKDRIQKWLLKS